MIQETILKALASRTRLHCYVMASILLLGLSTLRSQTASADRQSEEYKLRINILDKTDHPSEIKCIAISSDCGFVAFGGTDKSIRVWNIQTRNQICEKSGFAFPISSVHITPSRTVLAADKKEISCWNLETGRKIRQYPKELGALESQAFSPDGRILASGDPFWGIFLWDLDTGKEPFQIPSLTGKFTCVSFSADGKVLASADFDPSEGLKLKGGFHLWDVETRRELRQWNALGEVTSAIRFSPDGKILASISGWSGLPGRVSLWELDKDYRRYLLGEQASGILTVAFSPDGKSLATGDKNGRIRIWEVSTGEERCHLKAHQGPVLCLAFGRDGRIVASGGGDSAVYVWDLFSLYNPLETRDLDTSRVEELWKVLGQDNSEGPFHAIRIFAKRPDKCLSLLRQNLKASQITDKLVEKPKKLDRLRASRAIEILELIGTDEAQEVLKALALGPEKAWLTEEANASLNRLRGRVRQH